MENKYPEMTQEFRKYNKNNTNCSYKTTRLRTTKCGSWFILKTTEDIKLSLLGLWFRIQDKTERIKTLLMRDDKNSVQDEPVVDSYNDISVYGIMAQVVSRGKWAK